MDDLTRRGTERVYLIGLGITEAKDQAFADLNSCGVKFGFPVIRKTNKFKDRYDISLYELTRTKYFLNEVPFIEVIDIDLLKEFI